jgi:carbamoyl-phosphate synthase large subunit
VGSTTAISVIKGLKKQNEFDVSIVGTDINEKTSIAGSHFCDRFYRVPPAINETDYIHVLESIVNSESVDLIIPIVDIELEVIARNRDIIESSAYLLLSSYDTIMTCADKFKVYEFFKNVGIPTPKTILVNDSINFELIAKSGMNFPLIVKPRKGLGSRDVYEIRDEEELFLVQRVKNPILQEMCLGQEYTIDVFYDGTRLVSAVPRKRIETRSGISYKGETEKDVELAEYTRKIAEKLDIKGPANIQCFKAGKEARFTEVNPRFSGSLPLTIEAGVNTPLFGLKMAAGDKLEPVEDFKSVRMCRYWEEVFYNL